MSEEEQEEEREMSFLEHLEVMRWHLVRAIAAVMVMAIVAFIFNDIIFDKVLLLPKNPEFATNRWLCLFGQMIGTENLCINNQPFQIININMAGQFSTHIMVSLVAGVVLGFPYVFWEFWRFLKPALYQKEQTHARYAVFTASVLFGLGVLFGYYLIVPLSVHFLGSYSVSAEVMNQINLGSYISTVTSVVLAAGVIFELPVVIYFLSKVGLVTPQMLRKYRKHSLVVILALSAIITPPDVFSQVLVSLPLLVLYEIGIRISARIQREQEAALAKYD